MRHLLLLVLLCGCPEGPSEELQFEGRAGCDDRDHGTQAWFDEVVAPQVFEPYCQYCHRSDREGPDRHGAPDYLDFDDFDSARLATANTWARVQEATMPPVGALPTEAEYAILLEFLECTTPDNRDYAEELTDCPDASLTYAHVAPAFETHCASCHHSSLSGADRNGTPATANWDDPAAIRAKIDVMWGFVFTGFMPLGAPDFLAESPEDALLIYDYLSCGAPD